MRCEKCHTTFSGRSGQRFCSVTCKLAAQVRPPNRTCEACGMAFHASPSATGRFCSPACRHVGHRKGEKHACPICGADVIRRPSDVKYGFKAYCSTACRDQGRKVQPKRAGWHPRNFKGYRQTHSKGYVMAEAPINHPHPCRVAENGVLYVLEHRLVMERHLGRFLRPSEVVHHIDGNPANNRLENLMLFPNDAAHRRHHALLKRNRH